MATLTTTTQSLYKKFIQQNNSTRKGGFVFGLWYNKNMKDDKYEIKKLEIDGYEFEYNTENFDDVEMLDLIDEVESGAFQKLPKLLRVLLGEKTYTGLVNAMTEKHGRFKISKMDEVYSKIFNESPKD